jgi:pectate lyase
LRGSSAGRSGARPGHDAKLIRFRSAADAQVSFDAAIRIASNEDADGATFFDPSDLYPYSLDPTSEVKDLLTSCAGPRPTLGLP